MIRLFIFITLFILAAAFPEISFAQLDFPLDDNDDVKTKYKENITTAKDIILYILAGISLLAAIVCSNTFL